MKILTSIGFAAHVLIGNFCMMPMAYAQDGLMPGDMHHDVVDMTMSPQYPMSSVHCENCEKEKNIEEPPLKGMPCDGGHCLTHATSSNTIASPATNFFASVVLPPAAFVFPVAFEDFYTHPPSTAPPTTSVLTDTIVLRL